MSVLTYGPHEDADVPTSMVVKVKGRPGFAGFEVEIPIAPGVLAQRRRVNELAAGKPRRILDRREDPLSRSGG